MNSEKKCTVCDGSERKILENYIVSAGSGPKFRENCYVCDGSGCKSLENYNVSASSGRNLLENYNVSDDTGRKSIENYIIMVPMGLGANHSRIIMLSCRGVALGRFGRV